jgi:hypothetical protein
MAMQQQMIKHPWHPAATFSSMKKIINQDLIIAPMNKNQQTPMNLMPPHTELLQELADIF